MKYAVEDGILVITLLSEVPDGRAFVAKLEEIMKDEAVPSGLLVLLDVRQAKSAPSASEVRVVSNFFSSNPGFFGTTSALVVATTLQYGVARIGSAYEALRSRTMKVFRDEDEARAFLRSVRESESEP